MNCPLSKEDIVLPIAKPKKQNESDSIPGDGVGAVSGATFSASAASKGIKKWCALIY